MTIATANLEQARAWDGDEGETWTEQEQRYDGALRAYRGIFNGFCALRSSETVLDVGCGTGQSTRDAARVAARVLGIDLSGAMIRRARQRGAGTFVQGDAQVYPFEPESFDTVISRTGTMFFGDRVAAFGNLARALKPGGRLTMLTWQRADRNEWVTVMRDCLSDGREVPMPPPEAPSPFALAEPSLVRPMLERAGFAGVRFTPVDESFYLGADVADAVGFMAGTGIARWLLGLLDESGQAAALERLGEALAKSATPDGVTVAASAWIIQAHRTWM